jgi:hypothetical protein
MALITAQQVTIAGAAVTYSAPTVSDTVAPDERAFWHVKNTNASTRTATVVVPGTYFGQALADSATTIPALTGDRMIGPLVPALADPATGLITLTLSSVTDVTAAVVRI